MVVKDIEMSPRARKNTKKPNLNKIKEREIVKPKVNPQDSNVEKFFLVAQELKFVKTLAGNDAKLRDKVLKNLKIWLNARSRSSFAFTDADFLRLWKGLFYCMWMSDKPLVQESLSEELGSLVKCFDDVKVGLQFYGKFLETMCIEWFGIDNWRLDKFMMLVRRVTRKVLMLMHEDEWKLDLVDYFMKQIEGTILDSKKCPPGLFMHFNDLFLEEVAKVSEGDISKEVVHKLVEPYAVYYMKSSDLRLLRHTQKTIFYHLMFQSSFGQMYQEKFDLWKRSNFPTDNIDDIEFEVKYEQDDEMEIDDDLGDDEAKEEEKVYDPRAGRVNVVINEIEFDAEKIAEMFENLKWKNFVTSLGKKNAKNLIKKLRKFAAGSFPLGPQTIPSKRSLLPEDEEMHFDVDKAARDLMEFEKGDGSSSGEGKYKKKKKALDSDNPYPNFVKASSEGDGTNGTWIEEDNLSDTEKKVEIVVAEKKPKIVEKKKVKKVDKKLEKLKAKTEMKFKALKENKMKKKEGPKQVEKENVVEKTPSVAKEKIKLSKSPFKITDEWTEPLKEGETEHFIPSRKMKLKEIKQNEAKEKSLLVKNPFATPKSALKGKSSKLTSTPKTGPSPPSAGKRVKIALNKNVSQEHIDYLKHIKNSPQISFDSSKKPSKSLLKPNLMPSPINPFYQRKLKISLDDTL